MTRLTDNDIEELMEKSVKLMAKDSSINNVIGGYSNRANVVLSLVIIELLQRLLDKKVVVEENV